LVTPFGECQKTFAILYKCRVEGFAFKLFGCGRMSAIPAVNVLFDKSNRPMPSLMGKGIKKDKNLH
jgi:hypothetical protein